MSNPDDTWCVIWDLVEGLANGSIDQQQAITLLGVPAGDDIDGNVIVENVDPRISSLTVGDLSHVEIDVAVDIDFLPERGPTIADLEARYGPTNPVPPAPDLFDGSETRSVYYRPEGQPNWVRIFAKLTPPTTASIASLHIDREHAPSPT